MKSIPQPNGPVDVRYLAFLETISQIRPRLHRYCSRMTGSALDGEDVVQDALFEAYRKLDQFDDNRPLSPWLFRIAHNRCIDLIRKREIRRETELKAVESDVTPASETAVLGVGRAVEQLVLTLPPKERACILLKDVLDYSLEEVADLVDSTVGGVKAALKRGRTKLAASPTHGKVLPKSNEQLKRILPLYIERFNRHDWDGVRELVSADARLTVADAFAGRFVGSPYFGNYDRWKKEWMLSVGEADGEQVAVLLSREMSDWTPYSVVRLSVTGDQITSITDYAHCPWVLPAIESFVVELPPIMAQ
jgi:RNA polymerase sigma-70 factor (ECF subfamily)